MPLQGEEPAPGGSNNVVRLPYTTCYMDASSELRFRDVQPGLRRSRAAAGGKGQESRVWSFQRALLVHSRKVPTMLDGCPFRTEISRRTQGSGSPELLLEAEFKCSEINILKGHCHVHCGGPNNVVLPYMTFEMNVLGEQRLKPNQHCFMSVKVHSYTS